MRDFTLKMYTSLLNTLLSEEYDIQDVNKGLQSMKRNDNSHICIIRHDVDRKISNSISVANIEAELEISTTYYFRKIGNSFDYDSIDIIRSYGHEVGYHYETLDKAKGDLDKAIELFEQELTELRTRYDIDTICMHGSPLYKWKNSDIWNFSSYTDYGIESEALLSFSNLDIYYLSDTGRSWDSRKKVKDKLESDNDPLIVIKTIELINTIHSGLNYPLYINTHPQRWVDSISQWIIEYGSQNVKNIGKSLLRSR